MRTQKLVRGAVVLSACALWMGVRPAYAWGHKNVIETVGVGVADPAMTNETQRKATARDAALAEAQEKMLQAIKDVHPQGGAGGDQAIRNGILKGAEVVKTQWDNSGQCRVTLRLDKKLFQSLTGIVLSPP